MATTVTGRIIKFHVDREAAIISLDNDPKDGPKGNVWTLKRDHSNYNALYSLALAAAANRWTVRILIEGTSEIDPNREANIRRLAVDWESDN
jgi:hypothetical protein